jgi:hypothetical protein
LTFPSVCCVVSFALIVVLLCIVYPMLLVSLDSLLLTFPSVCSVVLLLWLSVNNKQSRDTGNIGHTTQDTDDNQSKRTTEQTEGKVNNRESRDTSNIGYTIHRRTTICCLYLWIVYNWLSLLFAVLFLCVDCRPCVCCVPNVTCISGLFIIHCALCLLCFSLALIVVLVCVVCPMLSDPEIQATLGTQDTKGQQWKQRNNTANRRESQL